MAPKDSFKNMQANLDARMEELFETTHECKSAILNHTKHITAMKKELTDKVNSRPFNELALMQKKFALNS